MRAEFLRMGLMYLGRRKVLRSGNRYVLSLPSRMADLWEELASKGVEVEVYVRVAEGKGS